MANSFMINIPADLSVEKLARDLATLYGSRGFSVTVTKLNNSTVLVFDKGCGGINTVLGLGQGIRATLTAKDGVLNVNYSDADWTGKIVGGVIFLVFGIGLIGLPVGITALIGTLNQLKLPDSISADITLLVG